MDETGIDMLSERSKHRRLLDDLKAASINPTENPGFSDEGEASFVFNLEPKKKKKDKAGYDGSSDWDDIFSSLTEPTFLRKAKKLKPEEYLPLESKKEKKKKKRDKLKGDEPTDFEKMFASEDQALTNLMREQSAFITSLQSEWNSTVARKGTSRGITKTSTELASNISSARTLQLNIIKAKQDLKKTMTDLTLKERKELGVNGSEEFDNTGYMGSNMIRQVIAERAQMSNDTISDRDVVDFDDLSEDDDVFEFLDESHVDSRSAAASKYLQFELMEPTIYVKLGPSKDPDDYEFVVLTKDGDDITDEYPLPNHGNISVNESLGKATDEYGQIFEILND